MSDYFARLAHRSAVDPVREPAHRLVADVESEEEIEEMGEDTSSTVMTGPERPTATHRPDGPPSPAAPVPGPDARPTVPIDIHKAQPPEQDTPRPTQPQPPTPPVTDRRAETARNLRPPADDRPETPAQRRPPSADEVRAALSHVDRLLLGPVSIGHEHDEQDSEESTTAETEGVVPRDLRTEDEAPPSTGEPGPVPDRDLVRSGEASTWLPPASPTTPVDPQDDQDRVTIDRIDITVVRPPRSESPTAPPRRPARATARLGHRRHWRSR